MKITEKIVSDWINMYNVPMSSKDISKKYSVSPGTVLKYLRKYDVIIRNQAALNIRNKKVYNESFFENIDTESKAYFLGLLYADGNVSRVKYQYRISLTISNIDAHILDDFKKELNGNMNIYTDDNASVLYFSGKKIVNDLKNIGLLPNKSLTIMFPKINKNLERHFIRGYFDGDGNIYIRKNKSSRCSVCSGSKIFLDELNKKLNKNINTKINNVYNIIHTQCSVIGWGRKIDIINLYNYFYEDSNFYIRRKKDIFYKSYILSKINNRKPTNYWTFERCEKEALKYNKRCDYKKKSKGSYNSAYYNKWLDEICEHMRKKTILEI